MDDPDTAERRGTTRHFTCYPFHLQKGEAGDTGDMEIAVIQDLSATGALVLLVAEIPVGDRVKLHLDFGALPVRVVEGRVVRAERRPIEQSDVWRFSAAVQFIDAQTEILPQIEELERTVRAAASG